MGGNLAIQSGGPFSYLDMLRPYLQPRAEVTVDGGIPQAPIRNRTAGLEANAHYFNHPQWTERWLQKIHRYPELRERWHALAGKWDGKVVVDVGCGPGNLFANLGGEPALLIGVDIARVSLERAAQLGYVPLLADAQALPLRSSIADVVALNATLHHVDDMRRVLLECGRLVKPGGALIVDHDPQQRAWAFRGPGRLLWNLGRGANRLLRRSAHLREEEQRWSRAAEIHHDPGDGVSEQLFCSTLEPLGFDVQIIPHNHYIGGAVLQGHMGRAPLPMRVRQRLSGIRPDSREGALTLLCLARRRHEPRPRGRQAQAGGVPW